MSTNRRSISVSAEIYEKIHNYVTATGYRSMSGFIEDLTCDKLGIPPVKVLGQHAQKFRIKPTENSTSQSSEEPNKFTVTPKVPAEAQSSQSVQPPQKSSKKPE